MAITRVTSADQITAFFGDNRRLTAATQITAFFSEPRRLTSAVMVVAFLEDEFAQEAQVHALSMPG